MLNVWGNEINTRVLPSSASPPLINKRLHTHRPGKDRLLNSCPLLLWTLKPGAGHHRAPHTYVLIVSLSVLLLVFLLPYFLSGHLHIVNFFCIISYVAASDEQQFVAHAESSRTERSTPPSARRVEHGLHRQRVIKALFASGILRDSEWRLRGFTETPA